jgi:putative two-component system hydrogenase maturation factor HypX/HoxX
MRILLLCSAFNGLSQRAWLELRARNHEVTVELAVSEAAILAAVERSQPDLIICPFLRQRVPADVWTRYRTIIVHPGPKGDRGPSSLDWAIMEGASLWGVTALQAVEEMDAGPIWATRTFPIPADPPAKSNLYNGPVADAALEVIGEVVDKAVDPSFEPEPLDGATDVIGRLRPAVRAVDRQFSWSDSTAAIVRRIRAADGSPGVRTTLCDTAVSVFDAHPGPQLEGEPGTIARRHHDAVLVRTGDGSVWIGQIRMADSDVKLPAALALGHRLGRVIEVLQPLDLPTLHVGRRELGYRRHGDVGVLSVDFYNGAMSTSQCRRLTAALRHAAAQPTKVLLIRGGDVFSNGIHLNVIHASPSPAMEAWRNINAIDDVCREIITCTDQLVTVSLRGNAGAGGVMLALGADRIIARDGVVLNPHYETMGLYGSEYWTYVLPRRVGDRAAMSLTRGCLPVSAAEAELAGLVDEVLCAQPDEFDGAVLEQAMQLAGRRDHHRLLAAKRDARADDERRKPLDAYRAEELAEMSRDLFDDRNGFAAARHQFVTKQPPVATPSRLAG